MVGPSVLLSLLHTIQAAAGQPLLQFAIFAIGVICQTVIITRLYNCTGRSIGTAVLTHATNGFVGTVVAYLVQPSTLDAAAYLACYLAVATIIILLTGGKLGASVVTGKSSVAA